MLFPYSAGMRVGGHVCQLIPARAVPLRRSLHFGQTSGRGVIHTHSKKKKHISVLLLAKNLLNLPILSIFRLLNRSLPSMYFVIKNYLVGFKTFSFLGGKCVICWKKKTFLAEGNISNFQNSFLFQHNLLLSNKKFNNFILVTMLNTGFSGKKSVLLKTCHLLTNSMICVFLLIITCFFSIPNGLFSMPE